MARRSYVISRPTILLNRRGVDLLEQVKEVPRNRLLHNFIEHPAQFASDRSLSRSRGDSLFAIRLLLFHVQIPTLASQSQSVAEPSVHVTALSDCVYSLSEEPLPKQALA